MSELEEELGFVFPPTLAECPTARPWVYGRDGADKARHHAEALAQLTAVEPWQTAWGRTPSTRD